MRPEADGARPAAGGPRPPAAPAWLEMPARVAVWIGGAAYVAVCLIVGVEVVLRKVAGVSLGGADEISGYVLAVTTAWALSFTAIHRAHVRIDALYALLPARLCAGLDLLALLALGYFAVLTTWWANTLLATSIEYGSTANTPLQTPLWIPQGLWVAGLVTFCLTLAMMIARAGWAFVRGDLATVRRVAGVRTVGDEIEEELGAGRPTTPPDVAH